MKTHKLIFLSILFIFNSSFCQSSVNEPKLIKGAIKDAKGTLPYVAVGIEGTIIGTLADSLGNYLIKIPKANCNDTLIFAYLGYKAQKIPINTIKNNVLNVTLEEDIFSLSEVVVTAKASKRKKVILGKTKDKGRTFGLYVGEGQLGSEFARLIKISKNKKFALNTVAIHLKRPKTENFNLLVNIYEQDEITKLPGKQLLKEVVIVNTDKMEIIEEYKYIKGWLKADLSAQNLVIDKPFYISFQPTTKPQNYKDYNHPHLVFNVSASTSGCVVRTSPFSEWEDTTDFGWVINCEGFLIYND